MMLKGIVAVSLVVFSIAPYAKDNPLFLEKIKNTHAYSAKTSITVNKSICGADDIQYIEEYDNRYSSIGFGYNYVQNLGASVGALKTSAVANRTGYCSGTLISENLFLTASHCVDNDTIGDYVSFGFQFTAQGGLRNSQQFFRVSAIVEDGASRGNLDYAILRLDGNPGYQNGDFPGANGTALGWKSVAANGVPDEVVIIQHPRGYPKQIDAGESVILTGNFIAYDDLDTLGGSSGSGVLDKNGNVVGVHTNGGCRTSGSGYNYGVYMQSIMNASDIL